MKLVSIATACMLVLASVDAAKTTQLPGLEKIKHVVYFMQENRSFDNYYGTMPGVKGFAGRTWVIKKFVPNATVF
ncbi:unnamed protein product [Absidia cylindrospora]